MITITIIIPASSILHWCLFSSTGGLKALVRTQWLAQHDATSGHRMAVAKSTGDDPPW